MIGGVSLIGLLGCIGAGWGDITYVPKSSFFFSSKNLLLHVNIIF